MRTLKSSRLFRKAHAEGRAAPEACVVVHLLSLDPGEDTPCGPCQVGFSVSKKVGNAVVRNRVKRRLRAILRVLAPDLPAGAALVVSARSRAATATFQELETSVRRALARAGARAT